MIKTPASIIGSGHTVFGRHENKNLEDLIVEAGREAVEEAGIPFADIDEVYLGHFNAGMVRDGFASSLIHQISPQMRFKPATRLENACASGSAAIFAGLDAIASGRARVVLVVGAEKMTSNSTAEVTKALASAGYQNNKEESALSFPQVFALAATAYEEKFKSPLEAMARIAVKNHENALLNPLAQMQRGLSFEDCHQVSEQNPIIAEPMRLTDCSLITDGAAAVVIASPDVAINYVKRSRFRSRAQVCDFLSLSAREFVKFEGPEKSIQLALSSAGIKISDVDLAEVHDCFTIAELLIYEAMGLAEKGEGYKVIENQTVFRDGSLPVNLSGGLKAKGHPIGATGVSMHVMVHRQLTGAAGDIQCPDANLGMVFNMGGAAVSNYCSILERVE